MNLGHRPSSLFGEEFLSAPIHPPISDRLIVPSRGAGAKCQDEPQGEGWTVLERAQANRPGRINPVRFGAGSCPPCFGVKYVEP
jgi:hypothetical protein